jgi:nitroreductase
VLILSLVKTHFGNGNLNRTAMHDVGAANTTMILEATALGLSAHMMGGFDQERTREQFNLSDELDSVAIIALGYAGPAEQLDEPFRTRENAPRQRKPLAEFAFEHQLPVTV